MIQCLIKGIYLVLENFQVSSQGLDYCKQINKLNIHLLYCQARLWSWKPLLLMNRLISAFDSYRINIKSLISTLCTAKLLIKTFWNVQLFFQLISSPFRRICMTHSICERQRIFMKNMPFPFQFLRLEVDWQTNIIKSTKYSNLPLPSVYAINEILNYIYKYVYINM